MFIELFVYFFLDIDGEFDPFDDTRYNITRQNFSQNKAVGSS